MYLGMYDFRVSQDLGIACTLASNIKDSVTYREA
jgi:hypothetical protein